jgi:alginate biosynthesis protein Alg44
MSYEAELQRQHPRYRLPMRATIEGTTYQVHDWSMNGFAIEVGGLTVGKEVMASLTIPFNGYDFAVTIPSEVLYSSAPMKRTSLVFLHLEDGQAGLLQYITDAVLSGEVVRAGDILDVARRSDAGRVMQIPPVPKMNTRAKLAFIARRLAASAGVIAIGAALVAFLSANVYDELFVVRSQSASVSAKTVNVASPAVGRLGFLNQKRDVSLGEPLMTINPAIGNPITVQSPCDCVQVEQRFANGDFVKMGEPIVRLMRSDAPVVVSAAVPSEKLMSLYGVKTARLVYADGTRVDNARILWLPGKGENQTDLPREPLSVVVDPAKKLPTGMIGQPVEVTFDLFGDSMIGRAFGAISGGISSLLGPKQANGAQP